MVFDNIKEFLDSVVENHLKKYEQYQILDEITFFIIMQKMEIYQLGNQEIMKNPLWMMHKKLLIN